MQARSSGDNQHNTGRQRFGKISFYTLLCFALAGLIAGFAIGGFAQHNADGSTAHSGSSISSTSSRNGHSPNSLTSPTPGDVFLGVPAIAPGDYSPHEKADGATSYRLAAQIINKNSNTPITATDVVCRLWLTDDAHAMAAALSDNDYQIPRTISSFDQPFPHEIAGALNFASASEQTHPCASNGKTSWSYTISSTVQPGTYYLAVLADWRGRHYNWYMAAINVVNS